MPQLCFMVMPYGRKPSQVEAGKGPGEIDFNALWDRAYVPVLRKLGYEPVRADQDVGSLIITQMLERLYFADLVLADMTIANGNVYYEVGIRHAAQKTGCVLLAADWSKPLFDAAQMRTVRYPLPEGEIEPATAEAIQAAVERPVAALARGASPMFEALRGYPGKVDPATASSMQDYLRDLAELQGAIRAVRLLPPARRMAEAKALAAKYGTPPIRPSVAIALVRMLREAVGPADDWSVVLEFIGTLPGDLADTPEFHEHRAFALSNTGQHHASAAELETLIERFGPTPERLGLLGGRYKRLAGQAPDEAERRRLRDLQIRAYERGMDLDLNEYYCASNLPRLYRARGRKGDEERARRVLGQVIMSCDRAIARGTTDEWLRPTLLNAAFDAADADKAEELADAIDDLGPAPYKVASTIGDLATSAAQVADPELRARLEAVADRLRRSLPGASPEQAPGPISEQPRAGGIGAAALAPRDGPAR